MALTRLIALAPVRWWHAFQQYQIRHRINCIDRDLNWIEVDRRHGYQLESQLIKARLQLLNQLDD